MRLSEECSRWRRCRRRRRTGEKAHTAEGGWGRQKISRFAGEGTFGRRMAADGLRCGLDFRSSLPHGRALGLAATVSPAAGSTFVHA